MRSRELPPQGAAGHDPAAGHVAPAEPGSAPHGPGDLADGPLAAWENDWIDLGGEG